MKVFSKKIPVLHVIYVLKVFLKSSNAGCPTKHDERKTTECCLCSLK